MMEDNALTDDGPSDKAQAVIDEIEERNVDFLRFQSTDILGTVKNVSTPASQAEKAFTEGTYFDGSPIDGFVRIQEFGMRLEPDLSASAVFPWQKKENSAAGRLICDVFNTSTGEPFSGDLRGVFKCAIEHVEELGCDVSIVPGPKFFLFEGDEDGRAATVTNSAGSYFDLVSKDLISDVHRNIIHSLESTGFNIEVSHHEVAEGQHEINFTYGDALSAVDNVATFWLVVHAITAEHDLHATFMPKPIPRIGGSDMHTHTSLFKDGENAFHDGDDEFDLSDTAKSFITGVLDHAPVIMAIADLMVNSYKRLALGYETPVYIVWPDRNRSALTRKPTARTPAASRIEACFLDPSCSLYFAFAAFIHAGLDGVEKSLSCPNPVHGNIYGFDEAKHEEYDIKTFPKDLGSTVDALEKDEVIQEALGDHVFEKFVEAKRSEFKDYLVDISQWELDRYLEMF